MLSEEQQVHLIEYLNPFSTIIAQTLSGSINPVFIYSNENFKTYKRTITNYF